MKPRLLVGGVVMALFWPLYVVHRLLRNWWVLTRQAFRWTAVEACLTARDVRDLFVDGWRR